MKNYDLKNIYDWPMRLQLLVFFIVFCMAFYAGYRWDILSMQERIENIQREEGDLKQQYELAVSKEALIRNQTNQVVQLKQLLAVWKSQLIKKSELPEILNEILKIGANNQLAFTLFNPGPESKVGAYIQKPIKIIAVGGYHQLANFISQVANLPWIIVVGNFTLSKDNRSELIGEKLAQQAEIDNLLTAEMTFEIYHLAENS